MPIEVFGAGAVQTAYVSFLALDITANSITLIWPTSFQDAPAVNDGIHINVLAASMTVTNGMANDHTITLPDATGSSVGANFIITNIGASNFNLLTSDAATLITIPPTSLSNSYWVQLTDNSTSIGEWQFIQFGAGTSQAQASALAGNGLVAISARLNTNVPVQTLAAPYTVLATDRANLFVWQGGTNNVYLPDLAFPPDVQAGFYVSFNNEGGGILNISGDANIDGSASIDVAPKESLTIITDGTEWWTLGFGQNQFSSFFVNGTAATPSISFINDEKTGMYYYPVAPVFLGVSVSGAQVAYFNNFGLNISNGSSLFIYDSTNVYSTIVSTSPTYSLLTWDNGVIQKTVAISGDVNNTNFIVGNTFKLNEDTSANNANIVFNDFPSIQISNAGVVTFPNTPPFTLAQGGTGGSTQLAAALNVLPAGGIGDIIYNDGVNWVVLPQGTDGQVLTLAAGIPSWA